MHVCMLIQFSPNFRKYVYEWIDEKCGRVYARNSRRQHYYCGEDLLWFIENERYDPADKFLEPIEHQAVSSEDELGDDRSCFNDLGRTRLLAFIVKSSMGQDIDARTADKKSNFREMLI